MHDPFGCGAGVGVRTSKPWPVFTHDVCAAVRSNASACVRLLSFFFILTVRGETLHLNARNVYCQLMLQTPFVKERKRCAVTSTTLLSTP